MIRDIVAASIPYAAFVALGAFALGLGGCQSNGTLTPSAQASVTAAYAAVCPPVLSGTLDPFAGQFNARAQAAYGSAKAICANGVPSNVVVAGLDILTVEAALAPYLAKAK